jgi:hypothetical protein
MKNLIPWTFHSKVGILVNKTLGSLLEFFDGLIVPPVGVISDLVVMATGRVKC